jgi:hypothetical protein
MDSASQGSFPDFPEAFQNSRPLKSQGGATNRQPRQVQLQLTIPEGVLPGIRLCYQERTVAFKRRSALTEDRASSSAIGFKKIAQPEFFASAHRHADP